MNNYCPVCGYDFKQPVEDSMICVCCGTQYGYHDSTASHAQLRERWMSGGAKWHSRRIPPPPDWSLVNQLRSIGCEVVIVDKKLEEQLEVAA